MIKLNFTKIKALTIAMVIAITSGLITTVTARANPPPIVEQDWRGVSSKVMVVAPIQTGPLILVGIVALIVTIALVQLLLALIKSRNRRRANKQTSPKASSEQ